MNRSTVANRWNLDLIEENYQSWRNDPASVEESWRTFFEGFELGQSDAGTTGGESQLAAARAQADVTRLIDGYREIGHYLADLDPLRLNPPRNSHELLDLSAFGLSEADLDTEFFNRLTDPPQCTLRQLIAILRETYCRKIGVEYMHIRNTQIRKWLRDRMEPIRNRPNYDLRKKRRIILKLNAAELFETFLHTHYVGQKRFSLEGGEMLIPLLDAIIERSAQHGVKEIVMGMPHRGRLNVLANILNKPYSMIFSEFEGNMPETVGGDGDVKYHLGFSADHVTTDKHLLHLSLTPNPSHLEAVNPVVEGRMRAKQRRFKDRDRKLGVPILIHGDAAFAGQGLVAETLNLSQLSGYKTGGTIHIVVNNQIGFTTAPAESRSTRYCTDVAKMIEVPIFHVNGEDPEAVVYVGELALDFRETFGQDVVIDMVCYRRHGHNEGDEPAFTQPLMYSKIRDRISIRDLYTENLVMTGELSSAEAETIQETFRDKMEEVYKEVHENHESPRPVQHEFAGNWKGLTVRFTFAPVNTGVPLETLKTIGTKLGTFPPQFHLNPKMERILAARQKAMTEGPVDWASAEAFALGSLLVERTPVRLSGQDSRRGTFSQRHAVIVDYETGASYIPLNSLDPNQVDLCIYDSLLSEAAVLGFDYGYSLDEPKMLIMWEAQFGDFANGAQVIIDQFIASGESKWGRASGIVMLLPHGYEGQGPEHSSARLERYLQLCAEDNIQVVTPTTPAQYFHVLRRQVRRNFRKPLIVMTPKSLLRHKLAVSPLDHFASGGFREVIDDATTEPERVRRVLVCGGKVYYDLIAKREQSGKTRDVAIVRLEQLYPWHADAIKAALGRYRGAREWVWVQEESQNMGAWTFVAPRLQELLGTAFQYVGRDASASTATGSHAIHDREQTELVEAAIGATLPHLVTAYPIHADVVVPVNKGVRLNMAAVPIKVPSVGESVSEGILAHWLKPDGASVKAGEPLYELETDKASQPVPAAASGVLKIGVAEGATVAVGSTVGTIDPEGQPSAASPPAPDKTAPAASSREAAQALPNGGAAGALSPAVRRLVTEENVDPSQVEGTGRGGRVTKGDVIEHLAAPKATAVAAPPAPSPVPEPPAPAAPRPSSSGRETRKRMSGIRQKIARRLVEVQQTAAILTTFNEADMSRVMDLRAKYKDVFKTKHGVGLGFMSFFVKATIEALKAFPSVNGRIDGSDIVLYNVYDIGVAVSTERGLMVPVLRDADKMSFAAIEKAIGAYAVKAREGTISVNDLQGGTFTITNGGVFGSLLSTPILNPPQSGILGMHAIQKRPVAIDDKVEIRPMMYLALSYDHRIIDGREAVSFLVRIKECIENPERLMLEI